MKGLLDKRVGCFEPLQDREYAPIRGIHLLVLFSLNLKAGYPTKLCRSLLPQQPTEYFDMGIFLAFFVVVSLVCLILLIKIKLKQRRSQVIVALSIGRA